MSLTKVSYSMVSGSPVNVLDYGASPSASGTVNTAAFVAALAASKAVFVPPGTYMLSDDALIDITDRTLFGIPFNGQGSGTGNATVITGNGDLFSISQRGTCLRDLTVYNSTTRGKLITVAGAGGYGKCEFIGCYFGKSNYHIYQSGAGDLTGWYISDCFFEDAALYSRAYTQLWAYTENKCYTTTCNNGFMVACGTTISIQNSVFEATTGVAFSLVATNAGVELDNILLSSVHFEGNGSAIGSPDINIETAAATRIRCVTFQSCTFFNPTGSQALRVTVVGGGGGNIDKVVFNNAVHNGSATLVSNVPSVSVNQSYTNGASELVYPTATNTNIVVNQQQNSFLGATFSAGAEIGSSGTVATIAIPSGTKFAEINVTGNYYNGVANTNDGYLVATYAASGSRIHNLFDINHSAGANQGWAVTVAGSNLVVKNKAALGAIQSGDVTISFFG